MSFLLTADLHLTDNASDEYRWSVFEQLHAIGKKHKCTTIYILGDVTDRRDRHSAQLVNRLTQELRRLLTAGFRVEILLGNHDLPVYGEPYWKALNYSFGENSGLRVITRPEVSHDFLLLPFSADPLKDWAKINFAQNRYIFMHQTLKGSVAANGQELRGDQLPELPPRAKVFSGDVHVPQKKGPITYIGTPYPIDFGDEYAHRFILLKPPAGVVDIPLNTIKKKMLRVSSANDLIQQCLSLTAGDQIAVKASIPLQQIQYWSAEENTIREWCAERGIAIGYIDVSVEYAKAGPTASEPVKYAGVDAVLTAYAEAEGIEGPLFDAGLSLLKKTASK